ncbi:unnamed protein product [Tilletia controversa]|uniref:Uncharacterized protein n=1 Tax=Tilletia caries TaxID=13290 RepID=A0A177V726_9BASI|nr:hypothetical protein CF336_g4931 [Tilletia laevis]KAE8260081.1 hypothetical protein A4X03_0g3920 [Tilletia caries]CAD6925169.1 unnamed protein product [Tilletia controversa]CAD6943144.1 unnamed protein product [Tilletia caries]CAD6950570.1 unnamed protein product [Tilletia controversa]
MDPTDHEPDEVARLIGYFSMTSSHAPNRPPVSTAISSVRSNFVIIVTFTRKLVIFFIAAQPQVIAVVLTFA